MNDHIALDVSPTQEILLLGDTQISDYVTKKRRNQQLGGIIATLNRELMFGTASARASARDALQKLGYVLD